MDCPTCKNLWEEFSDATKAHVAIIGKLQLAGIEQNSTAWRSLEPLTLAAAERQGKARTAFKEHEATHQNGSAQS